MLSTTTREQLEKFVESRPNLQELLERNILKEYECNAKVSYSLMKTVEQLLWRKRQCTLSQKLEHRPNVEELEQRGILCPTEDQMKGKELKRKRMEDFLKNRPSRKEITQLSPVEPHVKQVHSQLEQKL
ncbi:hypothetical protein ABK040_002563 [Willaertia magna]